MRIVKGSSFFLDERYLYPETQCIYVERLISDFIGLRLMAPGEKRTILHGASYHPHNLWFRGWMAPLDTLHVNFGNADLSFRLVTAVPEVDR